MSACLSPIWVLLLLAPCALYLVPSFWQQETAGSGRYRRPPDLFSLKRSRSLDSASHERVAPSASSGKPEDRTFSVKATLILGQKVSHFSERLPVRNSLDIYLAIHGGEFHACLTTAEPGAQFAPRRKMAVVYRNIEIVGYIAVHGPRRDLRRCI